MTGRLVRVLVDGEQPAGTHVASWDGTDAAGSAAPGGIYFYDLRANGQRRTGRLLLAR